MLRRQAVDTRRQYGLYRRRNDDALQRRRTPGQRSQLMKGSAELLQEQRCSISARDDVRPQRRQLIRRADQFLQDMVAMAGRQVLEVDLEFVAEPAPLVCWPGDGQPGRRSGRAVIRRTIRAPSNPASSSVRTATLDASSQ